MFQGGETSGKGRKLRKRSKGQAESLGFRMKIAGKF